MFLVRWRATGAYPMSLNNACSASGCGCAYSTNSKPSVPIGLSALTVAAGASCGNGPMADLILPDLSAWIFGRQRRNGYANHGNFGYDMHDLCTYWTFRA